MVLLVAGMEAQEAEKLRPAITPTGSGRCFYFGICEDECHLMNLSATALFPIMMDM